MGALLVGCYDDGGAFRYAGKVGTGYTRELLLELREKLDRLETPTSAFESGADVPRGAGVHWVKPRLVAEVAFGEWTQNDLLRQPRFEGLRLDKKPKQVVHERAKATKSVVKKASGRRSSPRVAAKTRGGKNASAATTRARRRARR